MEIEFRWREEDSKITGRVLRPVADIEFKSLSGEWIEAHPYIDSGADITLVPLSFGKLLGFEIGKENIQELRGIGEGVISVVVKEVQVKIGPYEFPARIAWSLIEEAPPLLGRLDIFAKFRITFDEAGKRILFEGKP